MKKVLVTGANGFIARQVLKSLPDYASEVLGTTRSQNPDGLNVPVVSIDLLDSEALLSLLNDFHPDVIIHTAAVTSVDYASQHPEETQALNVHATELLARWCGEQGARLVHFSTDFVFDGEKGIYDEEDVPAPLSVYGKSKLASEQSVIRYAADHLIIRPVLVFGYVSVSARLNFPLWVASRLKEGQKTFITGDQFRAPTYVKDLAEVTLRATFSDFIGLLNVSGGQQISIMDFARKTARAFKLDENLLIDVKTEQLDQAGKRPMKTAFTNERVKRLFDYVPTPIDQALLEMHECINRG